ncbi:SWIM zinc finger family protein [Corynebacterium sp. HMSC27B11]|uniref:SWIM zinc finger family protein n=1 Tax=Corynebacterium sp. HMSC27B11 TaxID=1581065 RepID=UPI0008A43D8C|nr:SWIM zinc finger family protein [Corynebacterium sp. HMSC27B11]OFS17950.1 hypothetical protein HMPREF3097_03300 [Corynebacterium sp. HMSC27B11]
MSRKNTPRTTWEGNVILADFGARRRAEAVTPRPSIPIPADPLGPESWAGAQLLEAVAGATDRGRLERGRDYHWGGHVQSMELSTNTVVALVAGTQPQPFEVVIKVAALSAKRRDFIAAEVAADPALLRTIIRGDAPPTDLAAMLLRPDQIRFEGCTCPDGAPVCKHAVAVAYQLADTFNHDPAAILQWRGVEAAEALRSVQLSHAGEQESSSTQPNSGSSAQQTPEVLDQAEFWGSEERRVSWSAPPVESGLELGDRDALMRALRSLSWTSVDQLQTMHELELCLEMITDDSGRFDPTPWARPVTGTRMK